MRPSNLRQRFGAHQCFRQPSLYDFRRTSIHYILENANCWLDFFKGLLHILLWMDNNVNTLFYLIKFGYDIGIVFIVSSFNCWLFDIQIY